jgi:hypothetical protein
MEKLTNEEISKKFEQMLDLVIMERPEILEQATEQAADAVLIFDMKGLDLREPSVVCQWYIRSYEEMRSAEKELSPDGEEFYNDIKRIIDKQCLPVVFSHDEISLVVGLSRAEGEEKPEGGDGSNAV